uniref:Putative transmembrane protein n=1 Tax=Toxoplasma gondii TgCATBr9 TaxID=943120 RepID=A0A2T6IST7_TOXGO|nr:putative transmembrane protein [Toxoplasma gondii TgCATBr9]
MKATRERGVQTDSPPSDPDPSRQLLCRQCLSRTNEPPSFVFSTDLSPDFRCSSLYTGSSCGNAGQASVSVESGSEVPLRKTNSRSGPKKPPEKWRMCSAGAEELPAWQFRSTEKGREQDKEGGAKYFLHQGEESHPDDALELASMAAAEPSLPVLDPGMVAATGAFLLLFAGVIFVACLYTMVISKLDWGGAAETDATQLAEGDQEFRTAVEAIRDDYYYCLLAPLSLVTLFPFVHWNWLSMKFFRHA